MAKRFGVSEEVIIEMEKGIKDPSRFSERELAALQFAEVMTKDSKKVTDELWNKLKKHFDDGEIIELTCVIGVFNYFNRFNNALGVDITV